MRFFSFTAAVMTALPITAHALGLEIPVQCEIGTDCFVQNYVDHDTTEGWKDFACGHLSYDGHKGTDFRIPTEKVMAEGVNVVAAKAGKVKAVRNDMKDINIRDLPNRKSIRGKECGNGLMLEHEDDWTTQYCHMKRGSIQVKPGDEVEAGAVLGQIGLSGNTEFPHLHFSVRHGDTIIDPFTNRGMSTACGKTGMSLWNVDAQKALEYNPPGVIVAGFSDKIVNQRDVMRGDAQPEAITSAAKKLIFWAHLYGVRKGDVVHTELISPAGVTMSESSKTLESSKAQYLQYVGNKQKNGKPWAAGAYLGRVKVTRMDGRDKLTPIMEEFSVNVSE